jgi:hypothetical protein
MGFKEDPQDGLLFFAEAALVCLALERFIRAILGAEAARRTPSTASSRRGRPFTTACSRSQTASCPNS